MAEMKFTKTVRDMDANTLFENHSVDEVRDIERKIRNDIEWKKEEMRDLVGERYRDLISAADTIKQMKVCAEKVGERLNSMNDQCQRLRDMGRSKSAALSTPTKPISIGGGTDQKAVYEIACEIKLLLAVPGKIWNYLDNREYLPAAKLYLLSKHIHGCLQYDTQTGGQVVSRFPVITKQWAAISHFKNSIIQGCRKALADYTLPSESIANALCCILLLEDKTPRQVFQDFLVARMFAASRISGVRNHITYAVQLIHNTVYQLTAVFCDTPAGISTSTGGDKGEEKCNILADSLSFLLQQPLLDQLAISEFSELRRHLPKTVTEYKPALRIQNVSLTEEYLKTSCDKWLKSCLENVRSSVREQLAYVTTIKSLTGVKQAVWETFTQDDRMKAWTLTCQTIFTEPVNLWIDELSPLFAHRVKEIIVEHFNTVLSATESQLKKSKNLILSSAKVNRSNSGADTECDMSAFIWHESSNDLPSMESWVTSSQKTFREGGGLLMKAHGFTPVVQGLCSRLNESMVSLLSEVETYRQTQEVNDDLQTLLNNQDQISSGTAQCVSNETYQALARLSDMIQKDIDSTTKLDSDDSPLTKQTCSWVLLLARFSTALPKLCPDVERCITLHSVSQAAGDQSLRKSLLMSRSLSVSSKAANIDPLWSESVQLLASTASNCYNIWLAFTSDSITKKFESELSVQDPAEALNNVTRWDDVEIQEETEDGKSVKSVISVPMQITWCLQNSLNELCREINRVGSHSLSRTLQTDLVGGVLLGILHVYKSCMDRYISQTMSLQYMFDLWYVTGLLLWKNSKQGAEIERTYNEMINTLQSNVDPFDLDVFTPYMQKHVAKHKSRNLVLFGAIADTEKVMTTSSRQAHGGRHEQHNVLPLYSSSGSRFSLLPIVSESLRSSASLTKSALSSQSMAKGKNPSITKISSEPVLKQSSSFYDRIGSGAMSWFTSTK